MAKIPKPTAGENVVQLKLSFVTHGNMEWFNHFGRQFGKFLRKINIATPSTITFLGIYPTNLKSYAHTTCLCLHTNVDSNFIYNLKN